jgi:hypothetical protein
MLLLPLPALSRGEVEAVAQRRLRVRGRARSLPDYKSFGFERIASQPMQSMHIAPAAPPLTPTLSPQERGEGEGYLVGLVGCRRRSLAGW